MGGRQVQRYLRLTELVPEVLDLVDRKKIGINLAVDIAGFDKELQGWIYEYVKDNGFLKPQQIEALKSTNNVENISQRVMIEIMNNALPEKKVSGKVTLSEKKLDKYFPPHFGARQREMVIVERLACGSASMARTFLPIFARPAARFIAVVVLPTPPF